MRFVVAFGIIFLFVGGVQAQNWKLEDIPVYEFEALQEALPEDENQLVILNFWATWCKPCVAEMPYFDAISKKYADDNEIKVLLISLDMSSQLETRLIPFMNQRQLHPEVWVLDDPDANSWIDKVDPSWSGAIPATLFYKGQKKAFFEQSFHSEQEIEDIIQTFK